MTGVLLKFEVLYWLVVGVTAIFSFSLPGLLLAAFGNIYVRDGISLARGLSVLWFIAAAMPLLGQPTTLQKVIGSVCTVAALVIFFLSYTQAHPPQQGQLLMMVIYSGMVLAITLFLFWTRGTLQGTAWIPAVIFLSLCVYSFLIAKRTNDRFGS